MARRFGRGAPCNPLPASLVVLNLPMSVGSIIAAILLGINGEKGAAALASTLSVWNFIGLRESVRHLVGTPTTMVGRKYAAWMLLQLAVTAGLFAASFYYYGIDRPASAVWGTISGVMGLLSMLYYHCQWREHRSEVHLYKRVDKRASADDDRAMLRVGV